MKLFLQGAASIAPAIRRLILAFVQGTPPRIKADARRAVNRSSRKKDESGLDAFSICDTILTDRLSVIE